MKGEYNRTVMIYVDSYENKVPAGRFHIASNREAHSFSSLSQLLLEINRDFDRENFPQSFSELRKFHTPSKQPDSVFSFVTQEKGETATFLVRILFRQNASWQGTITWIEGNQEESFRSVLELIVLLDNALEYACKQ